MNAEKELLLSLLIEKYTTKKTETFVYERVNQRVDRFVALNKKRRKVVHNWTVKEKKYLLQSRAEGKTWQEIMATLQLSNSQVTSMHYCLTHRKADK